MKAIDDSVAREASRVSGSLTKATVDNIGDVAVFLARQEARKHRGEAEDGSLGEKAATSTRTRISTREFMLLRAKSTGWCWMTPRLTYYAIALCLVQIV